MPKYPKLMDEYEEQLENWLSQGEINEEVRNRLRSAANRVFEALLAASTKEEILEDVGKLFPPEGYRTVVNHLKNIVDARNSHIKTEEKR